MKHGKLAAILGLLALALVVVAAAAAGRSQTAEP